MTDVENGRDPSLNTDASFVALFEQVPSLPDAALFAQAVETRLHRRQWMRRLSLATLGLVGALLSGMSVLNSEVGGLLRKLGSLSERLLASLLPSRLESLMPLLSVQHLLWFVAALLALAVTRVVQRTVGQD